MGALESRYLSQYELLPLRRAIVVNSGSNPGAMDLASWMVVFYITMV